MDRRVFSFAVLLLLSTPVFATPLERERERHVVLTPAHALTEADRAALAAEGVRIGRPLSGGRFLATVEDVEAASGDARVSRLEALTLNQKVHATAWRNAAVARPFGRFQVFFQDDVTFESARASVVAAGGAVDDPLAFDFEPLHSMAVKIAPAALTELASDENVLVVYGKRHFKVASGNATAAVLSHVTEVQAAPYSLTGAGVVLTYFELGPADSSHPEFGGRLTDEFQCKGSTDTDCSNSDNRTHATHVGGTMLAAGILAQAKGMAPGATLHEFRAADGAWLSIKDTSLKSLGSVADNNSWGYILGWDTDSSGNWVWYEGDELIGGYSGDLNAVIDHIALTNGTLMVHSAGNEGVTAGPTTAPYRHHHVDDNGDATSDWYCYSTNGSGTDCPVSATTCSAGAQFCETTRHPVHNVTNTDTGGSIGWTATSKNILAVGSTNNSPSISGFSSRGPTRDGRVKPDITAKGQSLLSTSLNGGYVTLQGTSMSSPVVTGTMALLAEQWRKTNSGSSPLPVTLKALTIAGAQDLGNAGPDYNYGFGFLNAKASIDLIIADGGTGKRVKIGTASQGSIVDYPMTVPSTQALRIVLTWFDPEVLPLGSEEIAAKALVNDLDVKVIDPTGATVLPYVLDPSHDIVVATRGVNTVDNVEEVEIGNAVPGTYHVIVTGTTVPAGPQQFVLVSTADLGGAACTDSNEPNDSTATATATANSQLSSGRICSSGDVDYFKFTATAAGTVSVLVTASDTSLKATLVTGGVSGSPTAIPAGASQTLTGVATGTSTQFYVRIEPSGSVGATGAYTLTATFPLTVPPRRHAVAH